MYVPGLPSVFVCADCVASAVNTTEIGLDTLEKEEEKARFFAQLEAGALSKQDYCKLNKELDSVSSSTATELRYGVAVLDIL